ncbi:hypothetical protein BYT27DRAFT_7186422 [Phlegmacium glaucopus]|nr:hypothetical protein BYT27DRAFT_7186422 [Phlegmacium glaucopus]
MLYIDKGTTKVHWKYDLKRQKSTSQEKYGKQVLSLLSGVNNPLKYNTADARPWLKGEKQGYEKQNSFNINFFLRFRFGRGLSSSSTSITSSSSFFIFLDVDFGLLRNYQLRQKP